MPNLFTQKQFLKMGVINLTPNSFSDGGEFFQSDWWEQDFDIFDIGAESTAPFNEAISQIDELARLEKYLYPHKDKLQGKTLSIDSYKLKTIESFLKFFNGYKIIINDVSGQLDLEYLEILKRHPEVSFVYAHNLVSSREHTSDHMNFTQTKLPDLKQYFKQAFELLKNHGLDGRVVFDPCFGFSKSREQNIELLEKLPSLIKGFDRDIPWLIGISRKSFLREPKDMDPKLKNNQEKLDLLQSSILTGLMNELNTSKLIMRVHTSDSFDRAQLALK